MSRFWILCVSVGLLSCNTGDISRQFTKKQAVRILTSDDSKLWSLSARYENGQQVPLTPCRDENTLLLKVNASDTLLYKIGKPENCNANSQPDTLYKVSWSLSQNISFIATDTLYLTSLEGKPLNPYVIRHLSPKTLGILYTDTNGNQITENYNY